MNSLDIYESKDSAFEMNIITRVNKFGVHPTSKLIKKRFSHDYDGVLMWREIENIKDKMLKYKHQKEEYISETRLEYAKYKEILRENKKLCSESIECKENLEKHIQSCTCGCTKKFISYYCQFKDDNGRCNHYYEIEDANETIGIIEYNIQNLNDEYYEYESDYEREVAKKQNRLKEYYEELEEEWEAACFELSKSMDKFY